MCNAVTHIDENGKRFTDYEVRMRTNLPIFRYDFDFLSTTWILNLLLSRLKEFSTRRRYSDFAWLKNELENSVAIVIPPLPGKAMMKQLPFLKNDDGIFEADFIEDRRQSLEEFINKVAGHPLVQSERSVHAFLQEVNLNRADFVPGKVNFPQY